MTGYLYRVLSGIGVGSLEDRYHHFIEGKLMLCHSIILDDMGVVDGICGDFVAAYGANRIYRLKGGWTGNTDDAEGTAWRSCYSTNSIVHLYTVEYFLDECVNRVLIFGIHLRGIAIGYHHTAGHGTMTEQ